MVPALVIVCAVPVFLKVFRVPVFVAETKVPLFSSVPKLLALLKLVKVALLSFTNPPLNLPSLAKFVMLPLLVT